MPRKPTGQPNGRPPKYRTAKEIQVKIENYFATNKRSLTITGLALHLGFEDRQSLYDYSKKGEFSSTIKRAVNRMVAFYESQLLNEDIKPAGVIFWLKNHQWSDRQEIEHSGKIEGVIRLPAKKEIGAPVDGMATAPTAS